MPRVRRRTKRRSVPLPDYQMQTLLKGVPLRRTDQGMAFYTDRDAQRRTWEEHREALLMQWIEAHPGTRPEAWWRFDASEPRRRVAGPEGIERDRLMAEFEERWPGMSTVRCGHQGLPGVQLPEDAYESEAAYLRRHGLITSEEAARCRD